jgi:hypothetical protein
MLGVLTSPLCARTVVAVVVLPKVGAVMPVYAKPSFNWRDMKILLPFSVYEPNGPHSRKPTLR